MIHQLTQVSGVISLHFPIDNNILSRKPRIHFCKKKNGKRT